jgi:hypothetical protein
MEPSGPVRMRKIPRLSGCRDNGAQGKGARSGSIQPGSSQASRRYMAFIAVATKNEGPGTMAS